MSEEEKKSGISRRSFLKGGAAGVIGVAALGGLAGCGSSSSTEETAEATTPAEAAAADGRVMGYSGPGDWLGSAPTVSEIAEEVDVDVVIVGSGHSGVQAALAAAEEGCTVAVIEKQTEKEMAWYGEDIGAWNSEFAKNAGYGTWDLGQVTSEFITRGGGRNFPDIVKAYVENSGETLDNMLAVAEEMGVDSKAYTYDNSTDGWVIIQTNMDYDKIAAGNDIYDCMNKTDYPLAPGTKTWASAVQFMGEYNDEPIEGIAANSVLPLIEQACIDKASSIGGTWYYGHTATVLVQGSDGAVTGCIAQDTDGNYIQINAAKGVIMCGGDYAGNADMCWGLLNEYMERNEREGGLKADFFSMMGGRSGESVKMMCWAGAYVEPAPRGTMILGGGLTGPWGANAMLWLNAAGERFCNEGNITGAQTASARQPTGAGYLVTDAKWMKSVCASGLEHGGPNGGRPQYYQDMIDGMAAIAVGADGGQVLNCTIAERGYSTVIAADTLEDLAGYMGVEDVDTFLASIEHYNELCAAGSDTEYGKDSSAMIPVDEAPFYGIVGTVGSRTASPSMVTMSGVMTDKHQNVLNASYEPIAGLYAAGNSLGGRYGTGYSTPCAGNSIGMAVTHGRVAGKTVAAL